jgi:adenylate cyclase
MSQITLDAIRHCLDGQIPGVIATCSQQGVPNSTYVSQVHYVDPLHVALSFQFFNKTRENILANPVVAIMVADPDTAARYRLQAHYLRTETDGAIFENMKAKLAGIASQTGMSAVFKLRGADIYRIATVAPVPNQSALPSPPRRSLLAAVRNIAQAIQACNELDELLNRCLAELETHLAVRHSMIHWLDESGERLYLVASRGYAQSGVGSEIQIGHGVIGVAASARTAIRVTHTTAEYTYSRAARASIRATQFADRLEAELPAPGLPSPGSQLAAPIVARGQLLGVLYVEDVADSQFGYDEEDALVTIAQHLGLAAFMLAQPVEADARKSKQPAGAPAPTGKPMALRHYPADDTVFVDDNYLIKGVAGAILWKLLRAYALEQRNEFTNRELRLDPTLRLPDLSSNLEARLILLKRRLAERCPDIALDSIGRGRFRMRIARPVKLLEAE